MKSYIYSLSHPTTNIVKYVGRTVNVKRRFNQHCSDKRNSAKAIWVQSLINDGLKPVMTILEECEDNWKEREQYWISQYTDLVNTNPGGGPDQRGKAVSEKTRNKLRDINVGRKHTKEHIELIRASVGGMRIKIDGVEYASQMDAVRALGISSPVISNRIKSKNFPNYLAM